MHLYSSFALSLLLSTPTAHAWGVVGHATVATIATHFLNPAGESYISSKLGVGVTMASVASWADNFRSTSAGRFSAPFHFIDAEDAPPTSCSVDLTRDCGPTGCVVSAISNYTSRANDNTLDAPAQQQALKFLIHFLGDITQPLHDEAEELGGNHIPVTWDGAATNLHACWDTQMVEKAAGGTNSTDTLAAFAGRLVGEIENGSYSAERDAWVKCVDVGRASQCALAWAQDANALNCQYVLRADETGVELDGSYYEGAVPYIELQIAKAGYRLGAWVNALAAVAAT